MFIEKRRDGKNIKYYLAHSYRDNDKVRKIRKYLGKNLSEKELKVANLTPSFIIKTLEKNQDIIIKHSVKKIGLFGSFLKGEVKKKSDLDFLVVFDKPTFDNYMELKIFLEKLFMRKIDLVTEYDLKPRVEYVKEEAMYARL